MSNQYKVRCDCGSVEVSMVGAPKVHAYFHCEDCRALLDVPYHSVVPGTQKTSALHRDKTKPPNTSTQRWR